MGRELTLQEFGAHLNKLANERVGQGVLAVLANEWVGVARIEMGKDTTQLFQRTRVVSVSDTSALLESDTPYAAAHNYGNPWTGPNLYWNKGQDAATALAAKLEQPLMREIGNVLESGGVFYPRKLMNGAVGFDFTGKL